MRSLRFALNDAIEDVDNQVALLQSKVATLQSQLATLAKAQADYDRAVPLMKSGAVTQEELDRRSRRCWLPRPRSKRRCKASIRFASLWVFRLNPPDRATISRKGPARSGSNFFLRPAGPIQPDAGGGPARRVNSLNKSRSKWSTDFIKAIPQGDIDQIYAQTS